MHNIKKTLATTLTILACVSTAVYATDVADGELIFKGGQTSEVVYSDIRDAKPNNDKYYKVWAAVKVGSNTYNSGWQDDEAYKEADRVWYANESSWYDYYER